LRFFDWVDERTGWRALRRAAFDFELQGGARWAYAFGSALAVVFLAQVLTGVLLTVRYSPTVLGAWASVLQVQHREALGGWLRGLHRQGASAMMFVMGAHLLQAAIYGAYKRPREVSWWTGLAMMALLCGFGFTGYALPWDQDGYWLTVAAADAAGRMPLVGQALRGLVLGGTECGQATLTRMFLLHVGVLPGFLGLLLLGHLALYRRHGPTAPAGANLARRERYFPKQLSRDLGLSAVVLGAVVFATTQLGAPLGAPADGGIAHAARPAGYFLWLIELRRLAPPHLEWLVTLALPVLGGAALFALPFLDQRPTTRVRARWPFVAPVSLAAAAIVALSFASLLADASDPGYQAQRRIADSRAVRSVALARRGVPPEGPLAMLADDPRTGGADVFARHCARCHVLGDRGERWAPDHSGFGSREWVRGQLHDPNGDEYFGRTRLTTMPSQDRLGDAQLRSVTEYLFSLGHEPQDPPFDTALAAAGARVFQTKCMTCHRFEGRGDSLGAGGPDMAGYASRTWIARRIAGPPGSHGGASRTRVFAGGLGARGVRVVAAYLRLQRFEPPPTGR
jgi:ubiquinol-cytochrome c reductase cytochrome b subunit